MNHKKKERVFKIKKRESRYYMFETLTKHYDIVFIKMNLYVVSFTIIKIVKPKRIRLEIL